jgi:predicted metalloendopeptidase
LRIAVAPLYVEEYFPQAAKAKMLELVDNVINTLDDGLGDLEWMTQETREQAKVKLSRFNAKIGYPDEWKDYSSMTIVRGDHFGNRQRANEWEHAREVDKLGKPIDRNEWGMTPQTVNAYYSPGMNEIVFPAARLQPPFFQLNADDAINYGAVGGVIGHEISHGFDDKGSQFDGDGNLVNWWTDEDRASFEERTKVLVEQYNQFSPIEGMTVNGELTLGENIGDLSGVTMAYRAYINSLNGAEPGQVQGCINHQPSCVGYPFAIGIPRERCLSQPRCVSRGVRNKSRRWDVAGAGRAGQNLVGFLSAPGVWTAMGFPDKRDSFLMAEWPKFRVSGNSPPGGTLFQ